MKTRWVAAWAQTPLYIITRWFWVCPSPNLRPYLFTAWASELPVLVPPVRLDVLLEQHDLRELLPADRAVEVLVLVVDLLVAREGGQVQEAPVALQAHQGLALVPGVDQRVPLQPLQA